MLGIGFIPTLYVHEIGIYSRDISIDMEQSNAHWDVDGRACKLAV